MIGQRLLHYEITEKLGEGGMGVVYKARDTHLNRFVAIKVLPPEKVADPERKRRFVQEAQSASALNHPNIIHIYDIDQQDGVDYIAMEHVQGKTLGELIGRKGLKLGEALRYGVQIAAALAKAHAVGIVHRDLKPGNVMVTADGLVKVLDFGLAKLTEEAPLNEDESTRTIRPTTEEGTIVGTVAYMSPEQAEGKPLDARSDIFSFGAVLYEMVTGRRAFQGDTRASTLAALLKDDPRPASQITPDLPKELERVIRRCLHKDLGRRYQHMDDVKIALEELKEESDSGKLVAVQAPASPRKRRLVWPALAVVAVAVLAAAGWWVLATREGTDPLPITRLTSDAGLTTDPAISPDGKLIAYASDRASGKDLDIWVQQSAGGPPIQITHGEMDEREPTFSPDGSQIAYSAGGIYIIPSLGGGEPRRLTPAGRRPRFSPDGKQILYSSGGRILASYIWLVDVAGGASRRLQRGSPWADWADYPVWSPDGKSILFSGRPPGPAKLGWYLTSPADEPARRLGDMEGQPEQWLPNGTVLYTSVLNLASPVRSTDLFAVRLSTLGRKPRRLLGGTGNVGAVSVAADGTAALFVSATAMLNLWSLPLEANSAKVTGEMQPLTQDVALNIQPSISADGRRLVFTSNIAGNSDIWFLDTATGSKRPLTVDPEPEVFPVVSPDGKQVAFTRGQSNRYSLWAVSLSDASSPGTPRKVYEPDSGIVRAWDWSYGNRGLFCMTSLTNPQIDFINVDSGMRSDYLKHPVRSLFQAHLSPDGRWVIVMYPGRVRVAPVRDGKPVGPDEWRIVVKGQADLPRWSPDGNTIYFFSDRDWFRCLYAQRLDPKTKEPIGEPLAVQHFHSTRRSTSYIQDSGAIGPALARDRIVFPLGEITGNIYLTRLPAR